MEIKPLSRTEQIIVQESNDELLVYDLEKNKAHCLNETSAFVWQHCDGTRTAKEIAQMLGKKLNQTVDENFVWLALDGLKKENLLAGADSMEIDFGGLSRREAIRKIGFASMIALPIVASLVAPNVTDAQSPVACTGFGQGTCPSSTDRCNNGFCQPCVGSGQPVPGGTCSPTNFQLCCNSCVAGSATCA